MLDRIQTGLRPVPPEQQQREKDVLILAGPPSGLSQAVGRGFGMRCAACGSGRMFRSFLQPVHACATCGIDWRKRTADDFPPYLVILLIGHIIAPAMIWMETTWHPPMWVHLSLWLPAVTLLALGLIQPVKGAVMAFQWWHWDFGKSPGQGASPSASASATIRESPSRCSAPVGAPSNSDVLAA